MRNNSIDYDAKGQRQRIEYGNGAITRYAYDEETYRLIQLLTTRPPGGNGLAANMFSSPDTIQDLHYSYDPAGNITRIEDRALQTIHHSGEIVQPAARYTYDALYRLIEAEGREHIGQCAIPAEKDNTRDFPFAGYNAHANDSQAMRNYTERYVYDEVGNFENFIHRATGGNWQRDYHYEEENLLVGESKVSNRLSKTILHPNGDAPRTSLYNYDEHGNMDMPHLESMEWDHNDQLAVSVRQDKNNGGTPETTFYVYDASGQRVRKVTERQAGPEGESVNKKERIYLGGFEVYREYNTDGDCTKERQSLHVMDDKQRIALVETKTLGQAENGDPLNRPLVRYQLGNHLGSASLELDSSAALISYEEYHPYGTTAFQLYAQEVSRKRYRYTGMERDEETGLNYHSARYYALWLGRWCSCDPEGLIDGENIYEYVRDRPLVLRDLFGVNGSSPKQLWLSESKAFDAQVTATRSGRGFTRKLYEYFGEIDELWGAPEFYDLGHDRPFVETPGGETGPVRIEERHANRSKGPSEGKIARKNGTAVRDTKGTHASTPKGSRFKQPDPPKVNSIKPRPITISEPPKPSVAAEVPKPSPPPQRQKTQAPKTSAEKKPNIPGENGTGGVGRISGWAGNMSIFLDIYTLARSLEEISEGADPFETLWAVPQPGPTEQEFLESEDATAGQEVELLPSIRDLTMGIGLEVFGEVSWSRGKEKKESFAGLIATTKYRAVDTVIPVKLFLG